MKTTQFMLLVLLFSFTSCGNADKSKSDVAETKTTVTEKPKSMIADPRENKGIGPITSVSLGATIDEEMAAHGKEIYDAKCTACHKPDTKFIGPAPTGIFERRSPEWIMNMILNPEEMVQKDPDAKMLLMEFNGSPMANQNLTEEEARAVLEYFRTL